jgi:ectoine hydroxylase-related dioxygenase (phytanoyl-CoA dioxygenase family)
MMLRQRCRVLVSATCFSLIIHTVIGFTSLSTQSLSSRLDSSSRLHNTNSNKTHNKTSNKNGQRKNGRASKKEINNMVESLGLTPVRNPKPKEHAQQKINVNLETQLQYARNGHAVLKGFLDPDSIPKLKKSLVSYATHKEIDAWKQKVMVKVGKEAMERCKTIADCQNVLLEHEHDLSIPFLQHFNIWRENNDVKQFILSSSLARAAKILMDVQHVKLYQDSLFIKRKEDGPTPWHSDARMAPFDTSNMITFWIPLSYIPHPYSGGTALYFVDKSHSDFALPFWNRVPKGDIGGEDYDGYRVKYSESKEYERLEERYNSEKGIKHYMPMNIGDCTVHSGWTLHSADDGSTMMEHQGDRYALAVTFVDAKAEIRDNLNMLGHSEDSKSYDDWIVDVKPRTYFEHPSVPIINV